MAEDADVIVVGGGLAGLVAATEIADAGKRVIVIDQEGEQSLGGQAFWSFGGLFLVDSPEQRRLGIKDSFDLALQDWMGSAGFDRDEDLWPRRWAEAYVAFAAGEKRGWLRAMGHRIFPVVGWAESGGYDAMSHGNSVPRFHVSWGTGPGIVEPFERRGGGLQAGGPRRLRCDDPWQFGAAVSCELGHRPGHCRAVRAAGARIPGERPPDLQIPPPCRCAHHHRRHRRRGQRNDPGA